MPGPMRSAITGVTMFHPSRVVTNKDLEKLVDTSDEWIRTRTGISERRYVDEGQAASHLAVGAVEQLLRQTDTSPEEVELIVVGTVTPDMLFPATACLIQQQIGAKKAWGFDLSAACSGFVFSLATGDQFIRSGKHKKVIVVGVDIMTSITNFEDRNTCVLFGDGAGAVMLEPVSKTAELGILDTVCHIDGTGAEFLYMPAGGSRRPPTAETVEKKMHFVHQEGKQVFKFAVCEMANVTEEILARNNFLPRDIDLFVAHQANLRIIESCQKRLGLPDEKVVVTIDKYANTTSATIPTCLATAVADGRLTKGKLVLITSFGAGFTWGAALVRWAY
ncbi:MAG TPA: beta-ketoacyl-ACP synthase III [Bdellovibrionota bacterium]|nr:beta-ketoacyl-ACP synthase III [Bdellovibrionota bacterium]